MIPTPDREHRFGDECPCPACTRAAEDLQDWPDAPLPADPDEGATYDEARRAGQAELF